MKRTNYLIIVLTAFIITIVFVSCSARKTNSEVPLNAASGIVPEKFGIVPVQEVNQTQNISLLDTIKLHYKVIEPENIFQAGNLSSFKKVKEERLGKVDGEQINISLYSDKDNNIHGIFKYKGKEYILNNLGYATDLESVEIYELQLVYNTNGKDIVLVSGIGSPILGYTYLIYDRSNESCFSFHNWGTPEIFDINQDGIGEVLLQFHGMHLNASDLDIFSFQDGRIMIADINNCVYSNGQLDTTKSKIASAYTKGQDGKVLVEISDLMSNEEPSLYLLECDKQNSSLLQLRREIQNNQLNK